MEQLINSMDLMQGIDDDSGYSEAFSSDFTLNPANQHMFRSITYRALNPAKPMPKINDELLNVISMPKKIKEQSKEHMEKIEELFPLEVVKKVAKNAFSRIPVATTDLKDDDQDGGGKCFKKPINNLKLEQILTKIFQQLSIPELK